MVTTKSKDQPAMGIDPSPPGEEQGASSTGITPNQDAEPVTPDPGHGHFPKLFGEPPEDHRAFLLWCMQSPAKRSKRLTAKASGLSEPTIRRRYKKWHWPERAKATAGAVGSDTLAWRQYLLDYVEVFRLEGVATVQANMAITGPETPLAVIRRRLGSQSEPSAHSRDSAIRAALEGAQDITAGMFKKVDGGAEAGGLAVDEGGDAGDASETTREKRARTWAALVNGTLGVYAKQLRYALDTKNETGSGVKVRPADLETLIALSQELEGLGATKTGDGPKESVRVRLARENGEDVLAAIAEDHTEIGAILEAVRNKRAQGVEHLKAELASVSGRGQVVELPAG